MQVQQNNTGPAIIDGIEDARLGATPNDHILALGTLSIEHVASDIADILETDTPFEDKIVHISKLTDSLDTATFYSVLPANYPEDELLQDVCGVLVSSEANVAPDNEIERFNGEYDLPNYRNPFTFVLENERWMMDTRDKYERVSWTLTRSCRNPIFVDKLRRVRNFAYSKFGILGSCRDGYGKFMLFHRDGPEGFALGEITSFVRQRVNNFEINTDVGLVPVCWEGIVSRWYKGPLKTDYMLAALSYPFPELARSIPFDMALLFFSHLLDSEPGGFAHMWLDYISSRIELVDCFEQPPFTFVKEFFTRSDRTKFVDRCIRDKLIVAAEERRLHHVRRTKMRSFFSYELVAAMSLLPALVDAKKVSTPTNFAWSLALLIAAFVPWRLIGEAIAKLVTRLTERETVKTKLSAAFDEVKAGIFSHIDVESGFKPEAIAISYHEALFPSKPESIDSGNTIFGSVVDRVVGKEKPRTRSLVSDIASMMGFDDNISAQIKDDFSYICEGIADQRIVRCLFASLGWITTILAGPTIATRGRGAVFVHHSLVTMYFLSYLNEIGAGAPKHEFFKGESFCPPEDWVKAIELAGSNWNVFKETPVGTALGQLISVVTLQPIMSLLGIDGETSGVVSKISFELRKANCTMDGLIGSVVVVSKAICNYFITGVLDTGGYDSLDSEWVECNRLFSVVDTGDFVREKTTPHDVLVKYEHLQEKLRYAVKTTSGSGKTFVEQRLIKLHDEMLKLRCRDIVGQQKPQPCMILLYGPPGTGKSVMTEALHRIAMHAAGDTRPMSVAGLNENENFDTTMTNATTCVTIDDIGLHKNPGKAKTAAVLVQKTVSSIYEASVKADLSEKGKIFPQVTSVIATSNLIDGGLFSEVHEAEAIRRRVHLFIELSVTDEVCSLMPNGKMVPDKDKMKEASVKGSSFQMFHRFTVYQCMPNLNSAERYNMPGLTNVDANVFLDFFCPSVARYWVTQRENYERLLAARNECICVHHKPIAFCASCQQLDAGSACDSSVGFLDVLSEGEQSDIDGEIKERQGVVNEIFEEGQKQVEEAYQQDLQAWVSAKNRAIAEGKPIPPHPVRHTINYDNFTLHGATLIRGESNPPPQPVPLEVQFQDSGFKAEALLWVTSCKECDKRTLDFALWMSKVSPVLYSWLFGVTGFVAYMMCFTLALCYCVIAFAIYLLLSVCFPDIIASACALFLTLAGFMCVYIIYRAVNDFKVLARESTISFWEYAQSSRLSVDTFFRRVQASLALFVLLNVALKIGYGAQRLLFGPESADIDVPIESVPVDPKVTWQVPSRVQLNKSAVAKTTTLDQFLPKLRRNIMSVIVKGPVVRKTRALVVNDGFFLIPSHTVAGVGKSVEMELSIDHDGQGYIVKREIVVDVESEIYHFPEKDLVGVHLKNVVSRSNITEYFGLSDLTGPFVFEHIEVDGDFVLKRRSCVGTPTSLNYPDAYNNMYVNAKGFSYPFKTYDGLCMSVGLVSSKGVCIAGVHVAGNRGNAGFMVQVTAHDIHEAERFFRRHCSYVKPMEVTSVRRELEGFTLHESDNIHPKSCVNFTTHSENPPVVLASLESHQTPRNSLVVHPLYVSVSNHLPCDTTDFAPVKLNFNRGMQPILDKVLEVNDPYDNVILQEAVAQVTEHLLIFAEKVKNDFPEESEILKGPFSTLQVSGEERVDNRFVSTMVANTSAGSPIDKAKNKVYALDENNKIILSDNTLSAVLEAEAALRIGLHTGDLYTAVPKGELRPPEKPPRIFFAGPMVTTIMTKRFFDPLVNAARCYPIETCCALGVDVTSEVWNHVIDYLSFGLGKDEVFIADMDYKNYDASQCKQIRDTIVPITRAIYSVWGWSAEDLDMMERVASLFLQPLVRMRDVVSELDLQPSGTTLTGRGNSIVNLVVQAYSFIKNNPGMKFFDIVHPFVQGDDNFAGIRREHSDLWTPFHLKHDLGPHGLVVTPGEKKSDDLSWRTWSDFPSFLSRRCIYNEDLESFVMVLDADACFKALKFIEKANVGDKTVYAQNLDFFKRERFLAGREEFEYVNTALRLVCEEHEVPIDFGVLAYGYDDMLTLYKERYSYPTRNTLQMPTALPDRYLICKGCFKPESEDVLKSQESTCTLEIGSFTPEPEHQARLLGGERIQSFQPLLKMFQEAGWYNTTTAYAMSTIYSVENPLSTNPFNMIVKSFKGMRGSIVMNYLIKGDGIVFLSRGLDPQATFTTPSAGGIEILDTRVNPTTTIVYPGPIGTRWVPVVGYLPQVSMPLKCIDFQDSNDSTMLLCRMAAGEDFSLLMCNGPPLVSILGTPSTPWYPESEEIGLNKYAMEDVGEDETSVSTPIDPTLVRASGMTSPIHWWQRAIVVGSITFSKDQYTNTQIEPVLSFFNHRFTKPHLTNAAYFRGTCVVRLEIWWSKSFRIRSYGSDDSESHV